MARRSHSREMHADDGRPQGATVTSIAAGERGGSVIASRWAPRHSPWMYVSAVVVGGVLYGSIRAFTQLIKPGDLTLGEVAILGSALLAGAVTGILANQWIDHRRRGRDTIASTCPRSFTGTVALGHHALALQPARRLRRGRAPIHVISRDDVSTASMRRTMLHQQELAVTFSDGSTACFYAPGFGSLPTDVATDVARAFALPDPRSGRVTESP